MLERDVSTLSGGELQRVAIALCLGRDADIYLLDEPSAYLDSNQRMEAARTIRRVMEKESRTGLIVDHDVYFWTWSPTASWCSPVNRAAVASARDRSRCAMG